MLQAAVTIVPLGTYATGVFDEGAQEIAAHDPSTQRLFVVNANASTVDVLDISGGAENAVVRNAGFEAFNGEDLPGVRIYGPGASAAQDLEPEYIAVSPDSSTAYVTLQENNALGVVDIASATVTAVLPLGTKDHSLSGNGIDASNRDGVINIQPWPVFGMYQPDAIAAYQAGGKTYLVTANEGDARDYDGFSEEIRIADLKIDWQFIRPNQWMTLQKEDHLGRLKSTTVGGDIDGDKRTDVLFSYGARSFTIWDAATGAVVFDSGDAFEQITTLYQVKQSE